MNPRVLKNFNLFVDGRGFAGIATNVALPELNLTTEGHRAGGMDGEIEIDLGQEAMEASFTLAEYTESVIGQWGLSDGNGTAVTARGAMQRDGEAVVPVVAQLRGQIKGFNPNEWEAGGKTEAEFTMAVRYYRLEIGGRTVIEIDVENMVRVVDGVDQLAGIRSAIGA